MDNKIIYDLIKELREDFKNEKDHAADWRVETSSRLGVIEVDLREHKEGVIQNREVLKKQDERLETLEEEGKAKKFFYNKSMSAFKFITAAGGALAILCGALGKYLDWF